ncbi:MAG TPA: helix-turn-helix domain-containing protein [Pseudonocardia sp.]|nr:helix-turn-helix domain-containing protein [Pseudonocardia sp.]
MSGNSVGSPAGAPVALAERAAEAMQQCAHELLPRSNEIAAEITARVLAKLPRLVPAGSAEAVDAVRESTDQNIGAILSTLAFGVPATATEPPLGARKLMRHSVTGGGDITDLLSAYRYGHELVWQHWSSYLGRRLAESDLLSEVLALSSRHIFTFIDRSCEHLVDEYRREFGGLRPPDGGRPAPAEVIRDLLGEAPVDESAASSLLRFDVHGHHVSLVLAPIDPTGDVRAALEALRAAAASTATLTLPVGDGTWWAWLSWPSRPADDLLVAIASTPLRGVLAGMGAPGRGRTGFRRSHHQAREADRAARLSRHPRPGVVRHRDVELAAVLCTDPDRARRLADDRLGALSSQDETGERLRETLLVYLSQGCSKTRTAQLMHVHHKTVSYRLAQAEALLGRPLTQDVLALGAALLIDRTLGGCQPVDERTDRASRTERT